MASIDKGEPLQCFDTLQFKHHKKIPKGTSSFVISSKNFIWYWCKGCHLAYLLDSNWDIYSTCLLDDDILIAILFKDCLCILDTRTWCILATIKHVFAATFSDVSFWSGKLYLKNSNAPGYLLSFDPMEFII